MWQNASPSAKVVILRWKSKVGSVWGDVSFWRGSTLAQVSIAPGLAGSHEETREVYICTASGGGALCFRGWDLINSVRLHGGMTEWPEPGMGPALIPLPSSPQNQVTLNSYPVKLPLTTLVRTTGQCDMSTLCSCWTSAQNDLFIIHASKNESCVFK